MAQAGSRFALEQRVSAAHRHFDSRPRAGVFTRVTFQNDEVGIGAWSDTSRALAGLKAFDGGERQRLEDGIEVEAGAFE